MIASTTTWVKLDVLREEYILKFYVCIYMEIYLYSHYNEYVLHS